ncbi:MAG: 7-cyano-7-deazaguanine synthase QueC [Acidobacteriota bacterium]|jgi:7-cyano-7-deazaguanine synthase
MAGHQSKQSKSEPSRPLAVVLVSGGMDSLTAAGLARQAGNNLAFIHFNYGQRTEVAELRAFGRLADFFGIPQSLRLVTHSNFFTLAGGSALTDMDASVPKADLDSDRIPITYVPFRNAVLLSQAVSWAEALGARYVYYGAVSQDSSGYPDCRPEFINAFNTLINAGTRPDSNITVKAPLVEMTKGEIIVTAKDLGLPLEATWSCYSRNDLACGVCDSCALRLRGFKQAGLEDPLAYAQPETAARLNSVDASRRERLERLHTLLRALTRAS